MLAASETLRDLEAAVDMYASDNVRKFCALARIYSESLCSEAYHRYPEIARELSIAIRQLQSAIRMDLQQARTSARSLLRSWSEVIAYHVLIRPLRVGVTGAPIARRSAPENATAMRWPPGWLNIDQGTPGCIASAGAGRDGAGAELAGAGLAAGAGAGIALVLTAGMTSCFPGKIRPGTWMIFGFAWKMRTH